MQVSRLVGFAAIIAICTSPVRSHEHDVPLVSGQTSVADQVRGMSCLCFQVCATIFGKGQLVRQAPTLIPNCKVLDGQVIGSNLKNCACPDVPVFTDPTSPNH